MFKTADQSSKAKQKIKHLGVQIPAEELDAFITQFRHGGASKWMQKQLQYFLVNLSKREQQLTKHNSKAESEIRKVVQEIMKEQNKHY